MRGNRSEWAELMILAPLVFATICILMLIHRLGSINGVKP